MPHVSMWTRVWGVNMMIPGPIDLLALRLGGLWGLLAYNVFALGVFTLGSTSLLDDVGHKTDLQLQFLESSSMAARGFCDPGDPPWWCE